jgi:RNA polymerase sigma-70 factor, ECF subfamily
MPPDRVELSMPTDQAALVAAAKDGDRAAFDELVRATYADAYTLAFRLTGNEEDARDVVQDAYLRAFRSIRKFRGDAQFSTWMYRIVANCAATTLGKRTRHRHEELHEDAVIGDDRPEVDPELLAEASAMRTRVEAALNRLPPRLRAVVVLRDVYDLPHNEIADQLGITEAAAKVRLHRARRRLREQLFPLRGEEEARAV